MLFIGHYLNFLDEFTIKIEALDIDHFKKINDSLGHLIGDQVLKKVATTIKSTIRNSDHLARFGGEEFVIFMKDTTLEEAQVVVEKIRSRIENAEIVINNQVVSCTVSLGLSSNYAGKTELTTQIEQADKALYFAKSKGRNCWQTMT